MPKLQIRLMRRRWGSCTRQGKIILNLELIKMPPQCIDYVITHELCHLIERNHTDKFYRILALVIPEWKKIKERLERFPL
jgi:predicted metal-dependent hydrolase